MCVDVKSDRVDPVVKSQACHIMVYDYYEPGIYALCGVKWKRRKLLNFIDLDFFSFQKCTLVYFVNIHIDSYANKSYKITYLSIHFVVKLNSNRLSLCLCDVVSKWLQVTSRNVLSLTSWRVRSRCIK